MSLEQYRRKRNFTKTAEPSANKSERKSKAISKSKGATKGRRFVIQKHAATRLHFDFRLELGGVLVSWAVPKGLPMKKGEKRLAIKVEDHPLSYFDFEGTIPKGEYGGGTVQVWDVGHFEPLSKAPLKELATGKLHVILEGSKLQGEWYLVRLREDDQWLIIRAGDDHPKLTKEQQDRSALSARTMKQVTEGAPKEEPAALKQSTKKAAKHQITDAAFIEPMKALSVETIPTGDWSYEIKFDGFRSLIYKEGDEVHLISRTKNDMTDQFPELVEAVSALRTKRAIIDGEIVALDEEGRSSFQRLQAYELGKEQPPLCFYAFDLLSLNGKSLLKLPLEKRKEQLHKLLPSNTSSLLRYSASLGGDAELLMKKIGELGLEGLIGKKVGSFYESGQRSGTWIKLKIVQQQEFVIGGYTEPTGSRQHIGALLIGVYDKQGEFIYAGKVGTGFNAATLRDLHQGFAKIAVKTCPFIDLPEEREGRYGQGITAKVMKSCHWVKPKMVCQVKFSEWTRDNRLRQPVYLGLRKDKKPKEVVRELSKSTQKA